MAALALILYVAYLALAVGLRTAIQLRRTGATGFHGIGGRPGSPQWIAGVGFAVALLPGLAGLVVALELQVRVVEEPYLLRVHGDDYARYAARVGRFAPGVGRVGR